VLWVLPVKRSFSVMTNSFRRLGLNRIACVVVGLAIGRLDRRSLLARADFS
jgi:hypothetical protein